MIADKGIEIIRQWEKRNPIRAKIVQAVSAIERASKAASRKNPLGMDYAYIDAALAVAITILASARAIAITEGNLADPAFDDGDVWDWDEEVGLPAAADAGDVEGGGL